MKISIECISEQGQVQVAQRHYIIASGWVLRFTDKLNIYIYITQF